MTSNNLLKVHSHLAKGKISQLLNFCQNLTAINFHKNIDFHLKRNRTLKYPKPSKNQVIYSRGFGARNLEANLPSTPHTLYGIGSCIKSFTALAIMQLVEQGILDVHDPVSNHLPEFKLGMKEYPIRIHHLLTHSLGIPSLGSAEILIERMCAIDESFIPPVA